MSLRNFSQKGGVRRLLGFLLPPEPPAALAEKPQAINLSANKRLRKILVVDDDAVIAKCLSVKLQSWGYAIIHASDGSEAIQALRENEPDLVLMDINFPPDIANPGVPWDGFRLVNWLRGLAAGATVPVIFMSAANVEPLKSQMKLTPGLDILAKPLDFKRLLNLITQALNEDLPRKAA